MLELNSYTGGIAISWLNGHVLGHFDVVSVATLYPVKIKKEEKRREEKKEMVEVDTRTDDAG